MVIRRLGLLFSFILTLAAAARAQSPWSPGLNPDPDKILNEARENAAAAQYEEALAKQVWFHENALKYAPAMYGVRLSFALSYWAQLGCMYPPALEKLRAIRDAAGEEVRNGPDDSKPLSERAGFSVRERFNEFAAINRALDEEPRTSEMFVWLDANTPREAHSAYDIAEPALIKSKQYKLCGKYLDPEKSFQRARWLREESMKAVADVGGDPADMKQLRELNEKNFSNNTATLVALLIINDRKAEAERIVEEAKKVNEDLEFGRQLQKAMKGEVPAPWP